MRTHSNYLIDGPLILTPERREARVAEMATELLAHNAYADQAVAINTLRAVGFDLIESIILVPDAMQFAAQHAVAREMAWS